MPRPGTIAADIENFLTSREDGAALSEITAALTGVRRSPVLDHSVRSAIYQHLGERGDGIFIRMKRGRYGLKSL